MVSPLFSSLLSIGVPALTLHDATPMDLDQQIDVFHGQVSPAMAYVYARLSDVPADGDWQLQGRINGPACEHAHMLPATVPMLSQKSGPTPLACGHLPDPCYWSPRTPALYSVDIDVICDQRHMTTVRRVLGIRTLGKKQNHLFFESRRWVLRAVDQNLVKSSTISQWRDASASVWITDPDEATCIESSQQGILLVADMRQCSDNTLRFDKVRAISHWPSVAIILVKHDMQIDDLVALRCPNILLAQYFPAGMQICPAASIGLVVVEVDTTQTFAEQIAKVSLPIAAIRRITGAEHVPAARAQCDRLQGDLAAVGDFAGYIIKGE